MISPKLRLGMYGAGCIVLMLACAPLGSTSVTQQAGDQTTAGETAPTRVDSWLAATLELRAVNLELQTDYPDSEARLVSTLIDASGNSHLWTLAPKPGGYAEMSDGPLPGNFDLFVIGGKAYTRIGAQSPVSPNDTYLPMLADLLSGPDGPGLWLNLLAEESFAPAGSESYFGFETTKYTVDGQVADGTVTGTIWIDDQASALVGAQLTISGSLYYPPGTGQSSEVNIGLRVHRQNVPPITLP
jgi:hypothetical protein